MQPAQNRSLWNWLGASTIGSSIGLWLLAFPSVGAVVAPGVGPTHGSQEDAQFAEEYACESGKVCRERATSVPLRVLPRSFSRIYEGAEEDSVKYENVPAFHPLYVFQRRGFDSTDSGTSIRSKSAKESILSAERRLPVDVALGPAINVFEQGGLIERAYDLQGERIAYVKSSVEQAAE